MLFMDRGNGDEDEGAHMHTAAVPTLPKGILGGFGSCLRRENVQHPFISHVLEHWSPLGAYLTPSEIAHLASACQVVTFRPGGRLHDSPFYVVVEGTVVVMSAEKSAADHAGELCTRSAGAFFTRHAGQGNVKQLAASAGGGAGFHDEHTELLGKTAGKVMLVGSDERLDDFVVDHCSAAGRDGYESIVSTNLATVLGDVPFIQKAELAEARAASCTPRRATRTLRPAPRPSTARRRAPPWRVQAALRSLAELCSYETASAGSFVFLQGDVADAFFIVLKGSVEVAPCALHLAPCTT